MELLETEHEGACCKRQSDAVLVCAFLQLHLRGVDFGNRILHQVHDVLQENLVRLRHVAEGVLRDRPSHDLGYGVSEGVL